MGGVTDLVSVHCSCGRVRRVPPSTRSYRCPCHMQIIVNAQGETQVWDSGVYMIEPRLALSNAGISWQSGLTDDEALALQERIAELEQRLSEQEQGSVRLTELEQLLAKKAARVTELEAQTSKHQEATEAMQEVVQDWYRLDQENQRLSRLLSNARDRGSVEVEELLRRAALLRRLGELVDIG